MARHSWFDVNVTVVGSARGLVVVDTHASERAMQDVLDALRRVSRDAVVGVVNTHAHFDHTFGNAVLREHAPSALMHAHEEAAATTVEARNACAPPDEMENGQTERDARGRVTAGVYDHRP